MSAAVAYYNKNSSQSPFQHQSFLPPTSFAQSFHTTVTTAITATASSDNNNNNNNNNNNSGRNNQFSSTAAAAPLAANNTPHKPSNLRRYGKVDDLSKLTESDWQSLQHESQIPKPSKHNFVSFSSSYHKASSFSTTTTADVADLPSSSSSSSSSSFLSSPLSSRYNDMPLASTQSFSFSPSEQKVAFLPVASFNNAHSTRANNNTLYRQNSAKNPNRVFSVVTAPPQQDYKTLDPYFAQHSLPGWDQSSGPQQISSLASTDYHAATTHHQQQLQQQQVAQTTLGLKQPAHEQEDSPKATAKKTPTKPIGKIQQLFGHRRCHSEILASAAGGNSTMVQARATRSSTRSTKSFEHSSQEEQSRTSENRPINTNLNTGMISEAQPMSISTNQSSAYSNASCAQGQVYGSDSVNGQNASPATKPMDCIPLLSGSSSSSSSSLSSAAASSGQSHNGAASLVKDTTRATLSSHHHHQQQAPASKGPMTKLKSLTRFVLRRQAGTVFHTSTASSSTGTETAAPPKPVAAPTRQADTKDSGAVSDSSRTVVNKAVSDQSSQSSQSSQTSQSKPAPMDVIDKSKTGSVAMQVNRPVPMLTNPQSSAALQMSHSRSSDNDALDKPVILHKAQSESDCTRIGVDALQAVEDSLSKSGLYKSRSERILTNPIPGAPTLKCMKNLRLMRVKQVNGRYVALSPPYDTETCLGPSSLIMRRYYQYEVGMQRIRFPETHL